MLLIVCGKVLLNKVDPVVVCIVEGDVDIVDGADAVVSIEFVSIVCDEVCALGN